VPPKITEEDPMSGRAKGAFDFSRDLAFVRHDKTRTVHVVRPPRIDAEERSARMGTPESAEIFVNAFLSRTPMMCGWETLITGLDDKHVTFVDCFDDNDLCARCVAALGSESWRAFEHPQPEREASR
jgi:hypothetical protein